MTEITNRKWLEIILSLKYIGNTCIYAGVIGYYTQAYWIFLLAIPLLITNALVILMLEWFNARELAIGVLGDAREQTKFIFLNTIWHLVPLVWVWYVLAKDDVILVFRPNFMGTFLAGAIFSIIYFYFASQGAYYGEIDYSRYMVIYIIVLFGVCVMLYGSS